MERERIIDGEDFIIPARDANGHSDRVWFRWSPEMGADVSRACGSIMWPYRNPGDLIRHAVLRHLEWLPGVRPSPTRVELVQAVAEIVRQEDEQMAFNTTIESVQKTVSSQIASGKVELARGFIRKLTATIAASPLDNPYRQWYLEELSRRFPNLYEAPATASPGFATFVEEE